MSYILGITRNRNILHAGVMNVLMLNQRYIKILLCFKGLHLRRKEFLQVNDV
jgi:hypothetical protein